MPTLRFTGRILPHGFTLTLMNYPRLKIWDYKKKADVGTMDISIDGNEITVLVNYIDPIDESYEVGALKNANDAVDEIVSLTAFQYGIGYGFIIDKIHYEDGRSHNMGIEEPHLAKIVTALSSEADIDFIVRLIADDKMLFLALRDLAESITHRHSAFINFARAIETIRNNFIPPGGERKHGWEPMRTSLNVGRSFTDKIMLAARGPRHGDRKWMQPDYGQIQEMAWQIMN